MRAVYGLIERPWFLLKDESYSNPTIGFTSSKKEIRPDTVVRTDRQLNGLPGGHLSMTNVNIEILKLSTAL